MVTRFFLANSTNSRKSFAGTSLCTASGRCPGSNEEMKVKSLFGSYGSLLYSTWFCTMAAQIVNRKL